MTGVAALVDRLRALGPEKARAILESVEAELGPEAIAALRFCPEFWLRPAQMVAPPYAAIEVFVGERGAGKSHAARELFSKLLPFTEFPRIVVPTDGAVAETVFGGPSGFRRWTPPDVRCRLVQDAGYAGKIFLGDHAITCTTAAAPVGAIGPGYGLTWADDVAAWIEAVGAQQAANAWAHVLKSNRERPGIMIVATTGRGVEFLWRLLTAEEKSGVRIHDLGKVENNAGNLTKNYLEKIVPGLRAANEWDEVEQHGAFAGVEWPKLRTMSVPRLRALGVWIDPAKSSERKACEVGVVGVGIDTRGIVYGLVDRSRQATSGEWPTLAHDLLEELVAEFPGVPHHFGVEINVGTWPSELLRAEERRRRLEAGKPGVSVIEIREVTSRPRDSKVKRAMPVVALAKSGQVRMVNGLGVLEGQLSGLVDDAPGFDRADAFVHGARELAGLGESDEKAMVQEQRRVSARAAWSRAEEAQAALPAPTFAEWDERA